MFLKLNNGIWILLIYVIDINITIQNIAFMLMVKKIIYDFVIFLKGIMMWYLLKWVEENPFFFISSVSRPPPNCPVKKEGLILYCPNKGEYTCKFEWCRNYLVKLFFTLDSTYNIMIKKTPFLCRLKCCMYKWILMIDKKNTHPHSWQDYNSPHIEKANKIAIIETCQINALRPCFECKYF